MNGIKLYFNNSIYYKLFSSQTSLLYKKKKNNKISHLFVRNKYDNLLFIHLLIYLFIFLN